ncbi:uncharacterized protein LOC117431082 [Acipenser ruthenus]|uniref:uncharacterized protein LOC117431082 n=1 Tax=Acipenser ruthenus TaxID=7906 RepID=UPI0027404CCE|nr:uncharacterized protein LOC117431082 [Acipenser ruthenus]
MKCRMYLLLLLLLFSLILSAADEFSTIYGELGGSVFLHLKKAWLLNNDGIIQKDNTTTVGRFKNNFTLVHSYKTHATLFSNGTFRMDRSQESDSGNYTVVTHDKDGRYSGTFVFQVIITIPPVYGVLGSSVFLYQKKGNHLNCSDFIWKKDGSWLVTFQNSTSSFHPENTIKAEIYPDGTLRLDNTQESDAGNYIVELTDENDTIIHTEGHHLILIEENKFEIVDGIEGSPVYLQLKGGNMRESSHIEWKRGNTPLAEFKENNTGYHGDSKNRSEIFSNGTLRLDSTQEHDTGTYSVDVFNGDGNIIQHGTVQLFIIRYKETTAVSGATGSSEFLYFGKTEFQNIYDIRWKKEGSLVAEFKGPTPRYYGDYGSRAEVFNNGTLRLDETQETDTGNYSVDFFYKNGTKNKIHTQLFLIDAVSEPELNYTCTPDGKVEFHCFLEKGADPSFTWSLNYKTLDGNSAPHSVKSQTLVLKDITGYVVCTAENSVSKQQSPIVFYSCEGFFTGKLLYLIICWGSLVALFTIALAVQLFLKSQISENHRRRRRSPARFQENAVPVNQGEKLQ